MTEYRLKETDSTNEYAKRIAKTQTEDALIIAEKQTAGKGRMGRTFHSENGGIYMSLLLHPEKNENPINITAMAAVAVARAIENTAERKAYIKWVNDIFVFGKKVCGILCEGAYGTEKNTFSYVVLGIGVNVFMPKGGFPEDIKDVAGALYETETAGVKERLIKEILCEFFAIYKNGREYMPEYKSRSNILGKEIKYTQNGKEFSGVAKDITDQGCLVIENESGKTIKNSGEIKIVNNFN